MQISTQAFSDRQEIPVKYCMPGAGGDNISLPVKWSQLPDGTESLALTVVDPHPIANNWIHWMVINIPADTDSLPEGASGKSMPAGARELANSFGKAGYGGPQPPKGTGEHPYVLTVYALDTKELSLAEDAGLEEFKRAIDGHILDKAQTTGMFEQK